MKEREVKLRLDCECKNEVIDFTYDLNDNLLFIDMKASLFYERQISPLIIIFNRIKHAWYMLRGQEFHMFEVVMCDGNKHLDEIEKWVCACKAVRG